jgi:hypothetical protein
MAVDVIEKAIYSLLSNDANVSGLVSTRIYPNEIPQGQDMPAIVYEQTAGDREHTMAGPIGMVNAGYVITCWSETYAVARQLADYVRIVLDGHSGTTGTQVVYVIFLENEMDNPARIADLQALKRYSKQLQFTVWFKEATS